jgi:polyhydroxyalkanoate synthesis regulator phasin
MTTETTPSIEVDWQSQWRTQRYERLLDTISEYLCDDGKDSGAKAFLDDLVKALKETRDWPERQNREIDVTLEAIQYVA